MSEAPQSNETGCRFTFAIVGVELVFVGWFLGQFLLDPARCGGLNCETMRAALNLSVIGAVAGIGCVALLACNNALNLRIRIPPNLLLVAATSAFAIAAVASIKAGLIILPLIDVILMLVPTGLLLASELTRGESEHKNKRREYLTWAVSGLTIVIAFAVVTSLIVLK
jgi:hypothetical protein